MRFYKRETHGTVLTLPHQGCPTVFHDGSRAPDNPMRDSRSQASARGVTDLGERAMSLNEDGIYSR